MKNELQIFNYESKEIRTIIVEDNPWWIAKDVCEVLGLTEVSKFMERLDKDEKLTRKIFVSGQERAMWVINESGLYSLIFRSNKPEAKNFKKWITSEVLPQIRKTGSYSVPQTTEQQLAQAVILANKVIEEQKPLVEFAKTVNESKDGMIIRDFVKLLRPRVGQNNFYSFMRGKRIIMKNSTLPYQSQIDNGNFEVKETAYIDKTGRPRATLTTQVTGKGQLYLEKKWREYNQYLRT